MFDTVCALTPFHTLSFIRGVQPTRALGGVAVVGLVLAGLVGASTADAADHNVETARLRIKDQRTIRKGTAKLRRSLDFRSFDSAIASPSSGSSSDPSLHGARLVVTNTDGSESALIELEASGWSGSGSGWRFRKKGKSAGASYKIIAKLADQSVTLKIRDKAGLAFRYSLDEAAQSGMAVVLELGSGAERYCGAVTAAHPGLVDSGGATGCAVRGEFSGANSAAPANCADVGAAPVQRDSCDAFDLIDLLVNAQLEATGIPGAGVAIVRNGLPFWSKGYGERHIGPSRPVLIDTPFMLASISKTITATAALQLVEDGVFGLDDDIDSILDFAVNNPQVPGDEVMTVRHLLTHTSGLIDDEDVWGGYPGQNNSLYALGDSPIALRDFMIGYFTPGGTWYRANRNFAGTQPGASYEYSNLATALLGYLVEVASGVPFDDYCDTNIFAPLGMNDTGWHFADFNANDVAMPYESFGSQRVEWGQYGFPDYPNGQLRSSAADLARYLAAWASGGILDGQRILEEATVADALTVQFPSIDATQGLSWYYETIGSRSVVGHNGGDYGATTDMFLDPTTGNGVILLINTGDTGPRLKAMQKIEEALFAIAEAP